MSGPTLSVPPRLSVELLESLPAGVTTAPGARLLRDVVAPFTGEVIACVPDGTAEDVAAAFGRARAAQTRWAGRALSERARVLIRVHDLMLERLDEALDLVQLESGKARMDAFEEALDVALVARYYAYHGPRLLRPERRSGFVPGLTRVEVHHHPVGVVGIIAPWNYPLTLAASDALPALLAGNAVVLKPAEQTPLAALWIKRLFEDAGLPPDLFHVVTGSGREVGAAVVDACDFLQFTGSTATGRLVAAEAGRRLVGSSMELGGKNPMLVFADADLERAAAGAVQGCFANAGQLCVSIERLYVQDTVFDDFLERFTRRTRALEIGPGYDFRIRVGSLASREQLDKVGAHVDAAVRAGAALVTGGRARPDLGPWFFEPTVLTGVRPEMDLACAETFGPVVAVYPFGSEDEGVALANEGEFGLNANVWTRDAARGRAVARRIRCGTVNVNEVYRASWGSTAAPMGGMRQSGLGRRHGPEGLLKYTEAQTIATQRLVPLAPFGPISNERFAEGVRRALKLVRRIPGLR